jgi:hypothetical protein
MSGINVVLSNRQQTTTGINVALSNQRQKVLINQAQPIRSIGDLIDVDISDKVDGSLLIYNASTQKFEASLLLDKQDIDGGIY